MLKALFRGRAKHQIVRKKQTFNLNSFEPSLNSGILIGKFVTYDKIC